MLHPKLVYSVLGFHFLFSIKIMIHRDNGVSSTATLFNLTLNFQEFCKWSYDQCCKVEVVFIMTCFHQAWTQTLLIFKSKHPIRNLIYSEHNDFSFVNRAARQYLYHLPIGLHDYSKFCCFFRRLPQLCTPLYE